MTELADNLDVVILGAHRSGTSLVAGLTQLLGIHLGDRLREANWRNPTGFFEDLDFLELNDRILKAAGGDAWHLPPVDAIRSQEPTFRAEIATLLERKSREHARWGWKATTTVVTLDLYVPHLSHPRFITVLRNPVAAASSAVEHRNNQLPLAEGVAFMTSMQHAISTTLARHPQVPNCFISYEALLANPLGHARRLAEFLGTPLSAEHADRVSQLVLQRADIRALKASTRARARRERLP